MAAEQPLSVAGQELSSAISVGSEMYELIRELYPICRSLTGDGVRQTLDLVARHVPLEVTEVPSGTRVFDWTVPKEWNIRSAWIADSRGERLIDMSSCNLHVLGYSVPIRAKMSLHDLRPHLYTLPDRPDWIPFRASYWVENWGFCMTHAQLERLTDEEYEVCIDSSLEDGHLTYGEAYLRGATADEFLVSSYICHPSVCNDGLSGIALVTMLAKHLRPLGLRHSYRFLLSPGTIGPLTWLSRNERRLPQIRAGLVLSCVGDAGDITYKKTFQGDAEIDQAAVVALRDSGDVYRVEEFVPWGGDERQFASPGFRLPAGSLMRTPPGTFPEYHTSADDLEFVDPVHLGDSFAKCIAVIDVLERNRRYVNLTPKGEPQLGRRGLYRSISTGVPRDEETSERALLWTLNLADGDHSLLDIAQRSGLAFRTIVEAADALCRHGLLRERPNPSYERFDD